MTDERAVGAYAATKHGLEGFLETLRRKLIFYGIDVIIVTPGSVATPVWDKAEQFDISTDADTDYIEAARRAREYMLQSGKTVFPLIN